MIRMRGGGGMLRRLLTELRSYMWILARAVVLVIVRPVVYRGTCFSKMCSVVGIIQSWTTRIHACV